MIFRRFLIYIYPKIFLFAQKLGIHVTPVNFNQPLPDTTKLKRSLWQKQSSLTGINLNADAQIKLLDYFREHFKREYDKFVLNKTAVPYQYFINNNLFESVDGEILYCMIRCFKPRRILEIGSGFSTYLSASALLKNNQEDVNLQPELTVIDPTPNQVIRSGFPGLSRVIQKEVQQMPFSEFATLRKNDILFVDSSHVVKIGSDLQYLFSEIIPKIGSGVIIHFHDIFLPLEYPKDWIFGRFNFFNEQYILQAFLAFNTSFEVLWAASYMNLKHPGKLAKAFRSYRQKQTFPASFWIRKK